MRRLWIGLIALGSLTVQWGFIPHESVFAQEKKKGPIITLETGTQEDAQNALKVATRYFQLEKERNIREAVQLVEKPFRKEFRKGLKENPFKMTSIDSITLRNEKRGRDATPIFIAYVQATGDVSAPEERKNVGVGMTLIFLEGKWWVTSSK